MAMSRSEKLVWMCDLRKEANCCSQIFWWSHSPWASCNSSIKDSLCAKMPDQSGVECITRPYEKRHAGRARASETLSRSNLCTTYVARSHLFGVPCSAICGLETNGLEAKWRRHTTIMDKQRYTLIMDKQGLGQCKLRLLSPLLPLCEKVWPTACYYCLVSLLLPLFLSMPMSHVCCQCKLSWWQLIAMLMLMVGNWSF